MAAKIQQCRKGQALKLNGDVQVILELNHKTPPNLASFIQCKTKSLRTGKVADHRFSPGENVEVIPLTHESYEFSYEDNEGYHFIHPETYEDVVLQPDMVEPIKGYLIENEKYELMFMEGQVATIEPPQVVELEVTEAPEGIKGDSANNPQKAAVLSTGITVQVPLFINPGDKVRIGTEDGKYLGRA